MQHMLHLQLLLSLIKISFKVKIHSGKGSEIPAVKIIPPYPTYMRIINKIRTGKNNDISWRVEKINIFLTGTLKPGAYKTIDIAVRNPKRFVTQVLRDALEKDGIDLRGKITIGKVPVGLDIIAIHKSQKLSELIKETLKNSNNLYAQCIFKTLGEKLAGNNSYKASIKVLKRKIFELTKINPKNYMLYDGAGLSRYNLVSPNQIVKLLHAIYRNKKLRSVILKSLPISGFDGTLDHRMKGVGIKGRIKAKTGTLNGTSALSGYLFLTSGNPVVFSVIANNELSMQGVIGEKTFENKLCLLLVKYFDLKFRTTNFTNKTNSRNH